jgi:uncharacterized protein (DUF1778 family)
MQIKRPKHFVKLPEEEKRNVRVAVRLHSTEYEAIRAAADVRHVSVSDFMRSTALGRKCDVRFEVDCILAISDAVRAIRAMHKAMVEHGVPPPEDEMRALILSAERSVIRLGN